MAKLVPAFIDEASPDGERAVFTMLAAGPADWLVFHSLNLTPWNGQRRTEIDFAVVIPDTGVICIEVKSHPSITFDGATWHPASITRSPFTQAADAAFALHRRFKKLSPGLGKIPIVHCCIFPNAPFRLLPSLVVQEYELIDGNSFRSFEKGEEFCAHLRDLTRQAIDADPALKATSTLISMGQLEELEKVMAPVRTRHPERRQEIEARYRRLDEYLRPQQKVVLNLVANNDRVLIRGPAGTGKTQLALEVARRRAEAGERVALLCFNRLFGEWMQREASSPPYPNLVADRAVRLMTEMCGISIRANPSQEFWDNELPDRIEEAVTAPEFLASAAFDYLVLDEAQDLLSRPRLWHCLMQFVVGGEKQGRFCLFGDFDYQALSGIEASVEALAALRRSGCATLMLTENCRNYRLIGGLAVAVAGLPAATYSDYLRIGGSLKDLTLHRYTSTESEIELLANALRELKAEGYRASEITILSCCDPEVSAASKLSAAGFHLSPAGDSVHQTQFTSVHAFKGLESRAVVITDISDLGTPEKRNALFVGMTRATGPLTLLFHESVGPHLATTLNKALNEGKN